jgi:hypothetical protein
VPNYTYPDKPDAAVKNRLGAATHDELEEREAEFVFSRDAEIMDGHGPTGQFDAAHLKAIHRHLFQDVYEWAGVPQDCASSEIAVKLIRHSRDSVPHPCHNQIELVPVQFFPAAPH